MTTVLSEPVPDSGMNKIAVGAAGLLLGLVFSVAGLIYYMRKSTGERIKFKNVPLMTAALTSVSVFCFFLIAERVLVPTTEVGI